MVYAERYVGFYLSFLIPTLVFCCALPVMFMCRNWYKRTPPEGSVLGPAVKLILMGMKGRIHANPIKTYRHLHDGTFWEGVKPSRLGSSAPKWMTFDDNWVNEVARGWAACSVFLWYPLYWICYNQINNNLTSQAATMSLNGVPNDIISNLDPFALIILIPICDLVIYPALRKANIHFTPIKKITAGFFCASLAMVWAAVIQAYIYKRSPCGSHASGTDANGDQCPNVDINVWTQTGAYVLIAISEIFASITSLEYGFSKAPKNMRSLVAAFALFMTAISSAIGKLSSPTAVSSIHANLYPRPSNTVQVKPFFQLQIDIDKFLAISKKNVARNLSIFMMLCEVCNEVHWFFTGMKMTRPLCPPLILLAAHY